jgi:3-(3-hydroxy-phenyl)propionate hydroxylase
MVNGGRLSVPTVYETPLSTPDDERWRGGPRPGTSMYDAPIDGRYLTDAFIDQGKRFTCVAFGNPGTVAAPDGVGVIRIGGEDGFAEGDQLAAKRYDAEPGTTYLLRPDGYVAARFRHPTRAVLDAALSRAAGLN